MKKEVKLGLLLIVFVSQQLNASKLNNNFPTKSLHSIVNQTANNSTHFVVPETSQNDPDFVGSEFHEFSSSFSDEVEPTKHLHLHDNSGDHGDKGKDKEERERLTGHRSILHVKSIFGCPTSTQYRLTNEHEHLTIFSPNYPLQYPLDTTCRYFITSPVGSRMAMACHIALPHFHYQQNVLGLAAVAGGGSKKCLKTGDAFLFSLNGDQSLAQYNSSLCGNFLLKSLSVSNKLGIGYTSGPKSIFSYLPATRKFKCKIKIVKKKHSGASSSSTPQNFVCGRQFQGRISSRQNNLVAENDESVWKNFTHQPQQGRIVGGTMAAMGQFPWRCALQVIKNGVVSQTCSCSILSNEWILSSVHCTINEATADVFIRVGTNSFRATDTAGLFSVSDIRRNPAYGTAGPHGDISVLKLSQPLVYSSTVSPICVSCRFDYDAGRFVTAPYTVSGWVEGPAGTFNLLSTQVRGQDPALCSILPPPIDGNEICLADQGKTTCNEMGDSGSDADYFDPATGIYYVAGIFTSGPCMTLMRPGIHQNINHYLGWIRQQTGTDFCQNSG